MLTRVEPKPLLVLVVSKGELMVPDTSCSCYDNYTILAGRLQAKADVKPVLSMAVVYGRM